MGRSAEKTKLDPGGKGRARVVKGTGRIGQGLGREVRAGISITFRQ